MITDYIVTIFLFSVLQQTRSNTPHHHRLRCRGLINVFYRANHIITYNIRVRKVKICSTYFRQKNISANITANTRYSGCWWWWLMMPERVDAVVKCLVEVTTGCRSLPNAYDSKYFTTTRSLLEKHLFADALHLGPVK